MKAFALVTKARAKTSPFLPGPLSISNTLLHRGGQSVGEFRHFFDGGIIAGCYGSIDARLQIAQLAQPADDAPADRLDHSGDVGIAVGA